MNALRLVSALLQKEILCLFRVPGRVVGLGSFVLVVVVLASICIREVALGQEEIDRVAGGLLWIVNAFSAILALQCIAAIEEEDAGAVGLLLSGVDMGLLFLTKTFSAMVLLFFCQVFALGAMMLFLNLSLATTWYLFIELIALVSLALGSLGVLLSAVAVSIKSSEMLLPVLLFPMSLPVLAAAVVLSTELLHTETFARFGFWYLLLCCFSLIVISLGSVLYEHILR